MVGLYTPATGIYRTWLAGWLVDGLVVGLLMVKSWLIMVFWLVGCLLVVVVLAVVGS